MSEEVIIHDTCFEEYISEIEIQRIVKRLASEVDNYYKNKEPLLLPVLNGSFVFVSDLCRNMRGDFRIEFIKLSSYSGKSSKGKIEDIIGFNDFRSRDVLIVEDIVDTGLTILELANKIKEQGAKSVKVVSLLSKPEMQECKPCIDFLGMEVENHFLVGYGLDYNGKGRSLRSIFKEKY